MPEAGKTIRKGLHQVDLTEYAQDLRTHSHIRIQRHKHGYAGKSHWECGGHDGKMVMIVLNRMQAKKDLNALSKCVCMYLILRGVIQIA
jgi:hypothetical protein